MKRHEYGWCLPKTAPVLMIETAALRAGIGYGLLAHSEENLWKLRKMGYEVILFRFGALNPLMFINCIYETMRRFTVKQLKDWLRYHNEVEYVFMKKGLEKGQPIAQSKYKEFKDWDNLFRILKDVKEE